MDTPSTLSPTPPQDGKIKGTTINPEDRLVSFDVTSLFTQVPINEAIKIVKEKLNSDESLQERTSIPVPQLVELIELCLRSTYFQFRDEYREQTDSAAKGLPLSPAVANLFMEDLEEKAIRSASLAPKTWFHYVDDTFVLWPHGEEQLHTFHQHLNQQNSNIQFTMELEKESYIPFLDVLVICEKDHLATTVY